MKREELSDAMGMLDEKILQETESIRARAKKKSVIRKWIAAAACLCLIASGTAFTVLGNQNLPQFPNQEILLCSGGGGGGSVRNDLSELENGNPWTAEMGLRKLPVYKNGSYSGSVALVGMNEEEMRKKLSDVAEDFGIQVKSVKTIADQTALLPLGTVSQIRAQGDTASIEVSADGTVIIQFIGGYDIPEDYHFTLDESTDEEAGAVMTYLSGQFADILSFSDPQVVLKGWNFYDKWTREYYLYDGSGNDTKDILNYNFRYVQFIPNGNGDLWRVVIHDYLTCGEKLGNYPLITEEEAGELLEDGAYFCYSMLRHSGEDILADVMKVEIVYVYSSAMEYLMPYYHFYVYVKDDYLEAKEGVKHYTSYYVPAVDSQYFSE